MTDCPSIHLAIVMLYIVICAVIDLWASLSYMTATSLMLVIVVIRLWEGKVVYFTWYKEFLSHWSEKVPGITVRLMFQSCKTGCHGPCLFQVGGAGKHSLVKVAKLQYKTAGHVLVYSSGVGGNTVRLRLQSWNVKLLAIVLFYSGGGLGNDGHYWSKTVFSTETTFTTLMTGPLSYRTGKIYIYIYIHNKIKKSKTNCHTHYFSQWLKLTSEDVKEQIYKLAKKGLTPSQIGMYLQVYIPQIAT